jgi:hypothetical protein
VLPRLSDIDSGFTVRRPISLSSYPLSSPPPSGSISFARALDTSCARSDSSPTPPSTAVSASDASGCAR